MGAPGYTPVSAMRGDIGSSTMAARDMKTKLGYAKYIIEGRSDLLRCVLYDMFDTGKDKLVKTIKRYMEEIGIAQLEDLGRLSESDLKNRVNNYDENKWRDELQEKSTLELYRQWKVKIREISWFDNTPGSGLLFKARSNSLKLGWRKRFEGGEGRCKLCDTGEEETLLHFMKDCNLYNE